VHQPHREPPNEPPRWPPHWWRRVHPLALVGALLVLAGAALATLAVLADGLWLLGGSSAAAALGLMLLSRALMPERNMHGTKVWQNDGLPGG